MGAALGAFAGRVHASVAALQPQALRRPSGTSPSLPICTPPHPPWVRRRRRTSCFVRFQRPHPQRTGSTLAVWPPHLPCMRPIGAGTRLPPLRSGRQTTQVRAEFILDSHGFTPTYRREAVARRGGVGERGGSPMAKGILREGKGKQAAKRPLKGAGRRPRQGEARPRATPIRRAPSREDEGAVSMAPADPPPERKCLLRL